MRKFGMRWMKKVGVRLECLNLREGEFVVDWMRIIVLIVEGRIKMVGL